MKIGLFSVNNNIMVGHFIGMHRDMRIRKALLATFSSAQFNSMVLNSNISKVVSYIQYNKLWERIYVIFKLLPAFISALHTDDSNNTGMEKDYYYSITTKISILKSSSNLERIPKR